MSAVIVLAALLVAGSQGALQGKPPAAPPGKTASLTAQDLPLVIAWPGGSDYKAIPGTNNMKRTFAVSIINGTRKEIASLQIRLRVMSATTGAILYKSEPLTVTPFENSQFPINGSLLPLNSPRFFDLAFTYPTEDWRTDTQDYMDVVGGQAYDGPQDLNVPSHLYSFLFNASGEEALAQFKAHPELIKEKSIEGVTALFMALAVSDLQTVKFLVDAGGSFKGRPLTKESAMHMAARNNHTDVLDFVYSTGELVNVKDAHSDSPLDRAIQVSNVEAAKWLLKHGADPNSIDDREVPSAYWALLGGDKEKLAGQVASGGAFLTGGPSDILETFSKSGEDVHRGQIAILDVLVKKGADVHFHDKYGRGWMHLAAGIGWMWDLIAKYGVPIDDEVGPYHVTPLMVAVMGSQGNSMKWLLEHGADPYLKDWEGKDSFELSKQNNTLHTDKFFREDVEKYWKGSKK